jgi:NADP-dependent 3-hydroxy acid dehydrogenase YdfG
MVRNTATSSDMDLSGSVAVVTGAGGGLGGGVARTLAAVGAAVVVYYRSSAEPAARVVDDITAGGGRAIAAQCNVTEPDGCTSLIAAAVEAFGRLDTVVANAGVQPVAELATMSVLRWREVVDTNVTGRVGIRVNSVSPGLIWRDGLDRDWPDGVARFQRAAPLGCSAGWLT